jgi:uncharacterized surface protein with fasciclin (FAS1) repeats
MRATCEETMTMRMNTGGLIRLTVLPAALLILSGCGGNDATREAMAATEVQMAPAGAVATPAAEGETIVDLAVATPELSTLVAAIQAADLAGTLAGPGPFTVFAPVNAAFEALPPGTVETLLQPANRDQLRSVLTYHVVPGRIRSSDLTDGARVTTVEGTELLIGLTGGPRVNGAAITAADIEASNGVVHLIDAVLLP